MEFRGTTICAVKKGGMTAIAGDGQVTMGESVIMKGNAVKVKRIYNDKVVIGFDRIAFLMTLSIYPSTPVSCPTM